MKEDKKIEENVEKKKNGKLIPILVIGIVVIILAVITILAVILTGDINRANNNTIQKSKLNVNSGSGIGTDLIAYKPIIYIYPTQELDVTLKVDKPENLTHTYPKYKDSWNVIAKPNGDLVDISTGRNLYALYWEGKNTITPTLEEGFIVKGEDTISFLEEKLEVLGLNERESNEFIIYWLPKLESNKYNYIRFQTAEQIEENMGLEILPAPDTVIRVMMEFKGLDQEIEVQEQQLPSIPIRNGFTVVEWGGTEI